MERPRPEHPRPERIRLTAAETAARLGVKTETLYAYVSRGLLSRQRNSQGSTFDPLEVEAFAASRRPAPGRGPVMIKDGRPSAGPLMTIDTDVALIEDDELYYRGSSATELARGRSFEAVCDWLWTGQSGRSQPFRPLPDVSRRMAPVLAALPDELRSTDRIRIAVPLIAGADPLRDDLDPASVAHRAGAMIKAIADALVRRPEGVGSVPDGEATVAATLAAALGPPQLAEREQVTRLINAALVLLVDHDLAVSTLAARAAASARANPYAVVISGLGALDSALHGNASGAAYRMIVAVRDGRPAREVISRSLAEGASAVPGFGHRIYRHHDPRAELIFALLAELPGTEAVLAASSGLAQVMAVQAAGFRNVDLALAALAVAAGMDSDAGEAIFAIARIGGWIAHALGEYQQPPLRLRPVGRYVGP